MLVLLNVAKPGSMVKKGEVIAEFDRQYQLLRLDDYRASVLQMEKNISKLKAELDVSQEAQRQAVRVAKADLEKGLLDLKTVEVRSEIDKERLRLYVEEAQARYKKALGDVALYDESQRAQLRAAEIDLRQAQIELKRAEANVGRMIMKAPIDGIVVMQTIFRGGEFGQVQQGDQVYPGMFFMSIVDPSSMILNANVNQVDSEMLRIGMKAQVKLDAYPDLRLPATVTGIGAMTKTGGWRAAYVREIPVRLKLDATEARVIPDLSASADVVLASERQAALAPREAVFYENGLERPFMFLRAASGWVRRDVELGLYDNVMVSVRSGLRKGDVVAVTRPPQS
jgi:multidrug resistance efflux pump